MPLSPNYVVISELAGCYARSDVLSVRCPGGVHPMSASPRQRLPNRRPSHTETLEVGGQGFTATIGFDECGRPRELFLTAGKEGSMLNALLADAAVVISIALQHGIPAAALVKSIGRLPAGPVTPANLEDPQPGRVSASPIGAALNLLQGFEKN